MCFENNNNNIDCNEYLYACFESEWKHHLWCPTGERVFKTYILQIYLSFAASVKVHFFWMLYGCIERIKCHNGNASKVNTEYNLIILQLQVGVSVSVREK